MSTETPETRQKSPYQLRCEALSRAIAAWQRQAAEADDAGDREATAAENASDLEDCLMDEGLILLPRSTGHGKWVVEVDVDGESAPVSGLLDAEEAADAFLTVTGADEYGAKQVTVRPATEMEFKLSLLQHITGGAA